MTDAEAIRSLPKRRFHKGDIVHCSFMGHFGRVDRYKLELFHADDGTPVPMRLVTYWLDHWRKEWAWEENLTSVAAARPTGQGSATDGTNFREGK